MTSEIQRRIDLAYGLCVALAVIPDLWVWGQLLFIQWPWVGFRPYYLNCIATVLLFFAAVGLVVFRGKLRWVALVLLGAKVLAAVVVNVALPGGSFLSPGFSLMGGITSLYETLPEMGLILLGLLCVRAGRRTGAGVASHDSAGKGELGYATNGESDSTLAMTLAIRAGFTITLLQFFRHASQMGVWLLIAIFQPSNVQPTELNATNLAIWAVYVGAAAGGVGGVWYVSRRRRSDGLRLMLAGASVLCVGVEPMHRLVYQDWMGSFTYTLQACSYASFIWLMLSPIELSRATTGPSTPSPSVP